MIQMSVLHEVMRRQHRETRPARSRAEEARHPRLC